MKYKLFLGDCLDVMRKWPDRCVDLIIGSPPYEDARLYDELQFNLKGEEWVKWMFVRIVEMVRVTRGLVAMVVSDKTENYDWTATTALLMADLKRAGYHLRRPPLYVRQGIMGSGGPDWLKNNYEPIVCVTHGGPLPWADNTAAGHKPKYAPGGNPSHRTKSGQRVNQWGQAKKSGRTRKKDGKLVDNVWPSHVYDAAYHPPVKANPGNLIDCGGVGKGHMGSDIAHETDAPFPEKLPDFFVRSFCPPGGVVCDPFTGSGTTAAVCCKTGRNFIGIDARKSQLVLTRKRIREARARAGFML